MTDEVTAEPEPETGAEESPRRASRTGLGTLEAARRAGRLSVSQPVLSVAAKAAEPASNSLLKAARAGTLAAAPAGLGSTTRFAEAAGITSAVKAAQAAGFGANRDYGALAGLNNVAKRLAEYKTPGLSGDSVLKMTGMSKALADFSGTVRFRKFFDSDLVGRMNASFLAAAGVNDPIRNQWRDLTKSALLSSSSDSVMSFAALQSAQLFDAVRAATDMASTRSSALEASGLKSALSIYSETQRIVDRFAEDTLSAVLRGRSLPLSLKVDSYLDSLPEHPLARRATTARFGLTGASAAVAFETLLTPTDDEALLLETARQTDEVVVEPWRDGSTQVREAIFAALADVEPEACELLKAVWDQIAHGGLAAGSLAAHGLVEVIDRVLRALASDSDLEAWFANEPPTSNSGYLHNGNPTRRARVTFAVRTRSRRDRTLIRAQETSLAGEANALMDALQPNKHTGLPAAKVVSVQAVSVEAFLAQLLLN